MDRVKTTTLTLAVVVAVLLRGETSHAEAGWLGISFRPVGPALQLVEVFDHSPAADCGLAAGDLLVWPDGSRLDQPRFLALIAASAVGQPVPLGVVRPGRGLHPVAPVLATRTEWMYRRLVGASAPSWELSMLDGTAMRSADLRGAVNVVAWFVPGCESCAAVINELARRRDDAGLRAVPLIAATGGDPAVVRSFVQRTPLAVPLAFDDGTSLRGYIPPALDQGVTFVLVDGRGLVRFAAFAANDDLLDDVTAATSRVLRSQ